jgi:hypothetical protein
MGGLVTSCSSQANSEPWSSNPAAGRTWLDGRQPRGAQGYACGSVASGASPSQPLGSARSLKPSSVLPNPGTNT